MKIKKETLKIDSVYYTTEIEYDNKIFQCSTSYFYYSPHNTDWYVQSDDCDFYKLPIETQNKIESLAEETWQKSDIFSKVNEVLNIIKH